MTDLVITNYDNFKDLSYFISQHKKASEIMEEVNNFYLSFLKSKLVYNYDIDKFQGKVIKEEFKDKKASNWIRSYENNYDQYVKGAHLQDENGDWFTITSIKKETKESWNNDKIKRFNCIYDLDRPYYISLYDIYASSTSYGLDDKIFKLEKNIESGYYNDSTKEELDKLYKKRENLIQKYNDYKELNNMLNSENYNCQINFKNKLANYIRKYENPEYYIIDLKSGEFRNFGNEEILKQYKFKISADNKYLIVYTEKYDGGTRKNKWKTYEYSGRRYNEFWFDVNNGNFIEEKNYLVKDYEFELDVHNGWHPYDDY